MEQDLYGLQASGIDPEIAAQMLGLKRKRAVADALMQQAMSPLKAQAAPQGGYAVPISPWEGIAQLAKAYMGSKSLEDLDKQQSDLSKQNQTKVADAVASYEQTKNGTPASVAPVSDAGPGDAVDTATDLNIPGKKGDPRAAIVQALSSPLLQNNPLVKMDAAALEKSQLPYTLNAGDVRFGGDNKPIAAAEFKPQAVAPLFKSIGQPGNKEQEHVSTDGGKTWTPLGAPTDKFNPRPTTQVSTNVALPAGQKAFEVETAKLDAKELDGYRDVATKAANGLSRVGEMKRLSEAGVYSGSFAEGRTGVANFFDTLGVPFDTKKLSNSQEYLKHAKELTLSLLKEGVGNNQISNADLKFVNDTVPQLETNPQARKNLLDYIERRLQTSVDRFNAADVYARKNGGLGGFAQQYGQAPAKPASGKPDDIDALLKKYGG